MANIYRVIFLFLYSTSSFADYPALETWSSSMAGGYFNQDTTAAGAVSKTLTAYNNFNGGTVCAGPIIPSSSLGVGFFDVSISYSGSCSAFPPQYAMVNVSYYCHPGGTLTGSTCSGVAPVGCPAAATPYPGGKQNFQGTGGGFEACVAGCKIECSDTLCLGGGSGATSWTYGKWSNTGISCTPGAPPVAPTNCPTGQVSGQFNGQTICLPSAPPTTGKTEGTKTTAKVNPDGSTTTTTTNTTTSCNGEGACSTNTTTTTNNYPPGANPATATPTSSTTETKAEQEPKTDFCKDNPNNAVCKKTESTFGGGCGSFSCDGDAVQCAISLDQHKRNCTLFETATPLSDLGNAVSSGTENLTGAVRSTEANRSVVNLSGSLDQSKVFSGGCIPDRSYTLWGGTNFTIPFSSLCPYLNFMGAIVLAFAYLSAARIVGVV